MNPHQLLMQEEGITYAELPSKAKAAITNFNQVIRMANQQKEKTIEAGKSYKMSDALIEKLEFIDDGIVSLLEDYIEQRAESSTESANNTQSSEPNQESAAIIEPKKQESMSTSNEPIKASPQGNKSPFKAIIEADGRIHADDLKGILGVRSIDNIDDEITVEGVALSRRMGYWYK